MYRTLIDAYALLGRRMWSVVGPRPYREPPAAPTMRVGPPEAAAVRGGAMC